jgi:hypothetical protein
MCIVSDCQDWAWCQTGHLFGDTTQEHVLQPSALVCPHDDEISVVLMGDAHRPTNPGFSLRQRRGAYLALSHTSSRRRFIQWLGSGS